MSTIVVGAGAASGLAGFEEELRAVREDAEAVVAGLSREQLNWRPGPGRWSIAQCLAHLTAVDSLYLRSIDRGIVAAQASDGQGGGEVRRGILGRVLAWSMEPPPRFRMKAPKAFRSGAVESPDLPVEETLSSYRSALDGVGERLRAAAGVNVSRARVASPVSPLLRISLGDAFAFLLAHERRHVWQARQVREHLEFPRA